MTNRQSSRQSARTSPRASSRTGMDAAPSRTSQRTSQRGGSEASARRRAAAGAGVGSKPLVVAGVVIGVLLLTVLFLYSIRSNEKQQVLSAEKKLKETREKNEDTAFQAAQKAVLAGTSYVSGRDEKIADEQLFSPFRGDENIYNVIFTRQYKDKKMQSKFDQKIMNKEVVSIKTFTATVSREGIQMNRGVTADDTQPLMVAKKIIPSDPSDKINMGGDITVVTKALKE